MKKIALLGVGFLFAATLFAGPARSVGDAEALPNDNGQIYCVVCDEESLGCKGANEGAVRCSTYWGLCRTSGYCWNG